MVQSSEEWREERRVGGGRRMEKDGEGVKEKERDTHTKEKKE